MAYCSSHIYAPKQRGNSLVVSKMLYYLISYGKKIITVVNCACTRSSKEQSRPKWHVREHQLKFLNKHKTSSNFYDVCLPELCYATRQAEKEGSKTSATKNLGSKDAHHHYRKTKHIKGFKQYRQKTI